MTVFGFQFSVFGKRAGGADLLRMGEFKTRYNLKEDPLFDFMKVKEPETKLKTENRKPKTGF